MLSGTVPYWSSVYVFLKILRSLSSEADLFIYIVLDVSAFPEANVNLHWKCFLKPGLFAEMV